MRCLVLLLLLTASLPGAAVTPLTVTAGVAGNSGRTGDQYAWTDANGRPRSAVLARNNVSGGGMLDRYVYQLATAAVRTVNALSGGQGASAMLFRICRMSMTALLRRTHSFASPIVSLVTTVR